MLIIVTCITRLSNASFYRQRMYLIVPINLLKCTNNVLSGFKYADTKILLKLMIFVYFMFFMI